MPSGAPAEAIAGPVDVDLPAGGWPSAASGRAAGSSHGIVTNTVIPKDRRMAAQRAARPFAAQAGLNGALPRETKFDHEPAPSEST